MALSGGCYCGAVRFEIEGPIRMRGLCLCRTCQRISGGAGNYFIGLEADSFRYTKGAPACFTLPDAEGAPTREFCAACGTHLAARSPRAPGGLIVKVGALDEPAAFGGPDFVTWTEAMQPLHVLPPGVPAFARFPGA